MEPFDKLVDNASKELSKLEGDWTMLKAARVLGKMPNYSAQRAAILSKVWNEKRAIEAYKYALLVRATRAANSAEFISMYFKDSKLAVNMEMRRLLRKNFCELPTKRGFTKSAQRSSDPTYIIPSDRLDTAHQMFHPSSFTTQSQIAYDFRKNVKQASETFGKSVDCRADTMKNLGFKQPKGKAR